MRGMTTSHRANSHEEGGEAAELRTVATRAVHDRKERSDIAKMKGRDKRGDARLSKDQGNKGTNCASHILGPRRLKTHCA